ncbi:endonuclease/exonuclease/phosphatase family protein [Catellatospora tritici]|uniref:endonuclease/exonuclease/phosphatase family protein n=1 Tax=Catellatospora tritici TaxID=2851566 RepID=UPI001C2D7ABD|nr:endonuclease/exonuclease/phosphatase family protein [Catellatospora tritici]MBV1852528.1 endonuclease/exonuclease/phosphatase family protein [Catellatospora tritici]
MTLRVVSYNVHSLRDDLSALASVVRDLDPDVLIVQEAPRRWRWRTKCAQLADSFGLVMGAGGLPGLGNVIMTNLRVRVREHWCLRYPLTPGRHLRGAVFARCEVYGRDPFVVVGSHLSTDDVERPAQAALLRPALAAVREPIVVGLDLNETPGGPSWGLLTEELADAAALAGRGDQGTFPTHGVDRRLDAILLDRRLELVDYRVHETEQAVRASDHYPLVVDLA